MKLQEIIRNNYKFAGIAAASFLIDEGMKNYVEEYDVLDTPKEILDGKAVLRRYHNKGAFLNFGEQKQKLVTLLSVLLTAAVLVVFVLTLGMRGKKLLKAGLSLLLGGAFSNTYDKSASSMLSAALQLFLLIKWRSLRTLLRSDFRASTESERRRVRVNCNKIRNL